MITSEATLAVITKELEGAQAWAQRAGHELTWNPGTLKLRLVMRRKNEDDPFYLFADFEHYPVLPPILTFAAEDGVGRDELRFFPKAEGPAPCKTWLFISFEGRGVICAPFSRLAYTGPHKEWGDAAHWRNVAPQYVQAHEIGPILAAIDRDFQYTKGRMA